MKGGKKEESLLCRPVGKESGIICKKIFQIRAPPAFIPEKSQETLCSVPPRRLMDALGGLLHQIYDGVSACRLTLHPESCARKGKGC